MYNNSIFCVQAGPLGKRSLHPDSNNCHPSIRPECCGQLPHHACGHDIQSRAFHQCSRWTFPRILDVRSLPISHNTSLIGTVLHQLKSEVGDSLGRKRRQSAHWLCGLVGNRFSIYIDVTHLLKYKRQCPAHPASVCLFFHFYMY